MAGIYASYRMETEMVTDVVQVLLEKAYYKCPQLASVSRVCVQDAATAVVLIDLSKREAARKGQRLSRISNEVAVNHLAAADHLLLFLDAILLPVLLADPSTSLPCIDALADCVRELHREATVVGGDFCIEVNSLCDYADAYHKMPSRQRPTELMKAAVAEMVTRVKSLRESTVTIPDSY